MSKCSLFDVDLNAILEETSGVPFNRLRELAQADKEGRCVVLPCKVGDTIFSIASGEVIAMTVESIHCWISGAWKISAHTNKESPYWKGYEISFDGFGKTVFLTRAEAEAALGGGGDA